MELMRLFLNNFLVILILLNAKYKRLIKVAVKNT
jgi:hypothetical protein